TYRSMMETFAAVMGRRRRIFTVPVLTPKLSAYWIDLVTPVDRGVAHALIEGLRNEVVCGEHAIRSIVSVTPTPYRAAVAATLDGRVDHAWTSLFAPDVPRRHVALLEADEADRRFDLTRPESAADAIVEVRATRVDASPEGVFGAVGEIGGRKGWYAANWAWRLRGAMDRLVGGPGLRRRVERKAVPEPGDALDFWRVRAVDAPRDLTLEAEMKVPGQAFLGFHVRAADDSTSVLIQRVAFEPAGWLGRAYWWALYPVHQMIFRQMLGNFARAVESAAGPAPPPDPADGP
ncbi:MAG: SDR family oxidoreductase, partial [Gemmatimonadota bacterium]|nr:SDR family oxidoreductase [Gemmatimonadota bacterium]